MPENSVLPLETGILIVAPNASTRYGGEAVLPVHYFRGLRARGQKVQLIAHARNRTDLDALFGVDAGIHFIDDTVWHKLLWRMGRPFPRRVAEAVFGTAMNMLNERMQARLIRRLVAEGSVDLIHQPTPVSPKAPSSIHGFGVPVVIGPMNGGMTYPPGFEEYENRVERIFVPIARQFAKLANHLSPGKKKAAVLLVANDRTRAALPVENPNTLTLVENGVDLTTWTAPHRTAPSGDGPCRLVFMGRLVDWKAVDLTLEALAIARTRGADVTLDILGDGAEREALEAATKRLGLENAVTFHGFRPQPECAAMLAASDALILNSLYECGGAVVLEAMAMGLPVIASEWGGPADYLDPETGILVPPNPRQDFTARLAAEINRLASDRGLRTRLGTAGAIKVRHEFDWAQKIGRIVDIYAKAQGQSGRALQ